MTDLNKIFETGRLTKDAKVEFIQTGTAKCEVSIAVNRSIKKGTEWVDEVSFFNVTIWGKTAQNLEPYLKKGTQILVEGYLKQDRWEKDGQKQSRVVIVADNVRLMGGNGKTENSSENTDFPEDNPFGN